MGATGGSVESITIQGRTFSMASDADTQRVLGGFTNEIQQNGDGTGRIIKTRVPWSLKGIAVSCDDDLEDQEFLQQINDGNNFVPVVITYSSGESYQGLGVVTGEMQFNSQASTVTLELSGQGALTKQ